MSDEQGVSLRPAIGRPAERGASRRLWQGLVEPWGTARDMLPHRKLGSSNGLNPKWLAPSERRLANGRVPTNGEVLISWSHAKDSPLRYRLLDISEGGMRIQSLLPVHEGMAGVALSLLPTATALNRNFQIMWCRRCTSDGGGSAYEAGARFTPAT